MSKKKYYALCITIILVACLVVIFHIPFLTLILGNEAVFRLRGLILIVITPLVIIVVSIISCILLNKLKKRFEKSQDEKQSEKSNNNKIGE